MRNSRRPKKVTNDPPKPKRPVGRPPKNKNKAEESSQVDTKQSSQAELSQARPLLSFFMNDPVLRRCEEASQMELDPEDVPDTYEDPNSWMNQHRYTREQWDDLQRIIAENRRKAQNSQ